MTEHRVVATRLHGDGTETIVADEIPVSDLRVMPALSGPGGLTGTISPEITRLRDRNGPILTPGLTAVYAVTEHGAVLGGGILTPHTTTRSGPDLNIDATGHAGYLDGQPYGGDRSWIDVDPATLIRHAWSHVQSRNRHNLGVTVDSTSTPVRLGTDEQTVSFQTGAGEQVDFDTGPVRWAWWQTHDLGREVDSLASTTPIEYLMTHRWTGSTFTHRLRLGYPRLGRRRTDLAFHVGVNILVQPPVGTADNVSDVIVLGAGEGSEQRRGAATRNPGGLGRTVTILDKSLTTHARCRDAARAYLASMSGGEDLTTVTVHDHPNAPLGSWQVGDDILIQGDGTGWAGDLSLWVRILSADIRPASRIATLRVIRAERI